MIQVKEDAATTESEKILCRLDSLNHQLSSSNVLRFLILILILASLSSLLGGGEDY